MARRKDHCRGMQKYLAVYQFQIAVAGTPFITCTVLVWKLVGDNIFVKTY